MGRWVGNTGIHSGCPHATVRQNYESLMSAGSLPGFHILLEHSITFVFLTDQLVMRETI